jgi:hypothetical protein
LWINSSADRLGIARSDLEAIVKANIEHKEKEEREQKAEERRREQHVKEERIAAVHAERDRKREQQQIDKAAADKRKQKEKAFATLSKLPSDQQEAHLVELAKHLAKILRCCVRSSKPSAVD